jgi:hypothetical protein
MLIEQQRQRHGERRLPDACLRRCRYDDIRVTTDDKPR